MWSCPGLLVPGSSPTHQPSIPNVATQSVAEADLVLVGVVGRGNVVPTLGDSRVQLTRTASVMDGLSQKNGYSIQRSPAGARRASGIRATGPPRTSENSAAGPSLCASVPAIGISRVAPRAGSRTGGYSK